MSYKEFVVGDYSLSVLDLNTPDVTVAVNGIAGGYGGLDREDVEFKSARKFGSTVHIRDTKCTWANSSSFEDLIVWLQKSLPSGKKLFVGNSMGGFYATLLQSYFPGSRLLCFAPQWSISPEIIPAEKRWKNLTRDLEIKIPSLSSTIEKSEYSLFFFGSQREERRHSRFFAKELSGGMGSAIQIQGCGHDVARVIKEAGLIGPLFEWMKSNDEPPDAETLSLEILNAGLKHKFLK